MSEAKSQEGKTGPKTYLVTGASSGIGLELVKQLVARGDTVYATCRKKSSSLTGVDAITAVSGNVTVIEGVDVADDGVGDVLTKALNGVAINVIVHNAGSVNGTRSTDPTKIFSEQELDQVSMDTMRACFEVNTLGPLRVQKALTAQIAQGGKVAIISTGLASIGDNSSGGKYAYRASKAAVNMVAKSMACDLKAKGLSVAAIAPGFVATEFGPGSETMKKWGAMPVEKSVGAIVGVLDSMSLDNTGSFFSVSKDGSVKSMEW